MIFALRGYLNSYGFFFLVLIVNLFQSAFTQLTGDEALYWMHGQNLDWGFRDHPPVIGAMTQLGYAVFQNELGVRLLVVFANTITIFLLWKLVKSQSFFVFVLIVLSIPVLNIYGFFATPDVPLLLAVVIYLHVWKSFLEEQNLKKSLWLGVTMAALMWSKYHGFFIIVLMMLPHVKLWFNKYFWLGGLIGIVLYSPHIIWQIVNDLTTIKFHLNDRNSDKWELKHILGYAGGQFLVFNPIVFIATIWLLVKTKAQDDFEKSMRWFFIGLLLFFLFDSTRGRVEPHWTAPLSFVAVFLMLSHIEIKSWMKYGLGFLAVVIVIGRLGLVFDFIPQLHREFHRNEAKMSALHDIAGDLPVCFMNSYQNPSIYMFYTGGIAHSINNEDGGKNQYDYWNYHEYIHQKPFVFVANYDKGGFEHIISGVYDFHMRKYNDLPVLHGLYILTDDWLHKVSVSDSISIPATIINRNNYDLQLEGGPHAIKWIAKFNHKKPNQASPELQIDDMPTYLGSKDSARITLHFVVPPLRGRNYLFFEAQVDDLNPTIQSNKLRFEVE
ncbi:MAG: glycosyltransferase family 39 protein [Flavobacteriales bacterium]|nr:glycosyltransferase family 39 protein [Flavobacteriales bacterium]